MQKLIDAGASLNIPDAVRTFVCTYVHAFLYYAFYILYTFLLNGHLY